MLLNGQLVNQPKSEVTLELTLDEARAMRQALYAALGQTQYTLGAGNKVVVRDLYEALTALPGIRV